MNSNTSTCKVYGCKYSTFHSTETHKCGKCHHYGHGRVECGSSQKIRDLHTFYKKCVFQYILSESALDTFCNINLVKTHLSPGKYTYVYGGLGSTIFIRQRENTIEGICIGNQDWAYNPTIVYEKDMLIEGYTYVEIDLEDFRYTK
jgi:hypothetical protein